MAYFPHAYQKLMVAKDGNSASGFIAAASTATSALTAGQLAVVDYKTNASIALSTSTTAVSNPLVYIAQGNWHTVDKLGPFHGGYKESVKTKGINPKFVSAFYVTSPANPVQDVVQVGSGLDCTTIACNTTYRLRVDIKGSPALRFLTHNAYLTVDGNSGCCDASNSNIDPNVVLLQWKDQINNSPIISQFVQANVWSRPNASVAVTATASAAQALTVSARDGIAAGARVVFTPTSATSATGSTISGNTFTVGTATTTVFSVGQVLTGTGVAAGTTIVSLVSGGGGTGSVFTVNITQEVASTTISSVTPVIAYVKSNHVTATGAGTVALVAAATLFTASTTDITAITTTSVATKFYNNISSATYVPTTGAAADTNEAFIELVGAFVETTFGNCSFTPTDHYELEPVHIYASVVEQDDLPCTTTCFTATEVQNAYQGKGFGESLVRDLILSKRYAQEPWTNDVRLREVLDDTTFTELSRSSKYFVYHILHSVPRKSNPSGMMDADQYLIKIVTPARNADFEVGFLKLLNTAGNYDCGTGGTATIGSTGIKLQA